MPKKVEITPEVRDVLSRGEWKGWLFVLPAGQLPRDLYVAVDKVLIALGGKWNKAQRGHMFSLDGKQAMQDALESGVAVDQKRTLDQFFTPIDIARQMADMLRLPRSDVRRVLEPSAGGGALVQALHEHGVEQIVILEIDPPLADKLADQASPYDVVMCTDFLTWEPHPGAPPIDAVMMNPPFSSGADIDHVTRAIHYLRPGGELVAIMSPHWTFASSAKAQAFRGAINEHSYEWVPLEDGTFTESGTGVRSGILHIRKGNI